MPKSWKLCRLYNTSPCQLCILYNALLAALADVYGANHAGAIEHRDAKRNPPANRQRVYKAYLILIDSSIAKMPGRNELLWHPRSLQSSMPYYIHAHFFFLRKEQRPEEEYNLEFSIFFLLLLRCNEPIQYTAAFFYSFLFSAAQRLATDFSARRHIVWRFFCLWRGGLSMPSQAV